MPSAGDPGALADVTTVHGGLNDAELRAHGIDRADVLDFSSNVNPLGASPLVRKAAAEADLSAYPDRDCLQLREALAARLGIGVDHLLIGNGSTELIHLLARACLAPRARCLIFAPTFGEYQEAARLSGADVKSLPASEAAGFSWSIPGALREIEKTRPALVFLCNPNNPTGAYLARDSIDRLIAALGPRGQLVLDTSYVPLADDEWDPTPLLNAGNVALLQSMTKDHGLAGVRLGYLAAQPPVIQASRRLQPAWSVNAVAQAVGIAALADGAHVAAARSVIRESKNYLYSQLAAIDLHTIPSASNFMLVRVGHASKVRQALLRRGIAVRDCTSFGLLAYIRIAIRRLDECASLVAALRDLPPHD